MKPHSGGYTTAEREAALKEAEENLVRPGGDDAKQVSLRLGEITTHPVLFQPRSFLSSRLGDSGEIDQHWVERLQRRIASIGELNPLTVVNLGGDWTITDGHHRCEAYRKNGWERPLKCVWFEGSAREAMDAAAQSSAELKLEASREDHEEECWKRVLIGGWTREQIRKICHVSPNLITRMNDVVAWYHNRASRNATVRAFRVAYPDLKECSWFTANLAYLGATPTERTEEEQAQALARRLRTRFDLNSRHSLAKAPKITAMALERYDRKLPQELTKAWAKAINQRPSEPQRP
jgi:hypothetical protein